MATSGTATFSIDRNTIIATILRRLRILQDGATATANQISDTAQAINIWLKNVQSQGLIVSQFAQVSFPCQNAKVSYTIGPSGADVTSWRPLRLYDGSFWRKTVSGVVTDTPLQLYSRQQYEQQTTKAATGSISAVYYQPNIDIAGGLTSPGTGWGTVYLYLPTTDTTITVYLNVLRPIYDLGSTTTQEIDLPSEWFQAIIWGVAADMADEFEVPEDRLMRLQKKAQFYLEQLGEWNRNVDNVNYGDNRVATARVLAEDPKVR